MPFDEDARGKDFRADPEYFGRPPAAVRIVVSCPSAPELGEDVIELPAQTFLPELEEP